jgi:TusA-related sulfurtransferase
MEVDLTQYGCPLHYIKAREAVNKLKVTEEVYFLVNNGDAVTDVMNSLRQDGEFCEIEQQMPSVTRLKVIKQ